MDVSAEGSIDVNEPKTRHRRWGAVVAILTAVALMAGLSGAIVYVVRGETVSTFDPADTARLAPSDSHLFLAFNTTLTSDPWLAVPRLLNALGIEDQVRDDMRESAFEDGFDYDEDLMAVLTSIRRLGLVVQYLGSDDGEVVGFVHTRDAGKVVRLMKAVNVEGEWTRYRDATRGLDFDVFAPARDGLESGVAMTVHDEVVYVSDDVAAILRFLRRQEDQPSLADAEEFRAAIREVSEDALLVGYGSGGVLAHPDFQDLLDGLEDTSDVDMTAATLAFSFTAEQSGWGGHIAVRLASGFGAFAEAVMEPADIETVAALTPADALMFTAGSGLAEALRESMASLRLQSPDLLEEFVVPFEEMVGLSFEDDIIPLIGSSYGFALGLPDDTTTVTTETLPWVLGALESTDALILDGHVRQIVSTFEDQCECDLGVRSMREGDYVTLRWSEAELASGRLSDSVAFRELLALLPQSPSALFFLNARGVPADLVADLTNDFSSDPEAYDIAWDALLGVGITVSGSETSLAIDFAMPINTAAQE